MDLKLVVKSYLVGIQYEVFFTLLEYLYSYLSRISVMHLVHYTFFNNIFTFCFTTFILWNFGYFEDLDKHFIK